MSIAQQLQTLERSELIRLAAREPELAYLFRHAMVREAAYASLLRADRKHLHRVAAEALEAVYTATGQLVSAEVAALLAQHFHLAGEPRAQAYATQAGEAALARYANAEAVSYFSMALEWARQGSAATPLLALSVARGRALELNSQFTLALENYQALEAEGRARGDQRLVLQALVSIGTLRSTINPLFDPAEGQRLADEALPLAAAVGDTAAESKVHWNLLNLYRFTGDFLAARAQGEQALALASGQVTLEAATLNDLIHIYGALGDWPGVWSAAAGAVQRWRRLNNLPMLADSLATHAMYSAMHGDYAASVASAAEARQIALSTNNLWGHTYSLAGVGLAHWQRGDYTPALATTRACQALADPAGFLAAKAIVGAQLAVMLLDLGQPQAALAASRSALSLAQRYLPLFAAQCLGLAALAHTALADWPAAQATLSEIPLTEAQELRWMTSQVWHAHVELARRRQTPEALALARQQVTLAEAYQMQPISVEARLTLARVLRASGDAVGANATLRAALTPARELSLRRLLWQLCAELAGLASEASDAGAAEAWRREAQDTIDYITGGLTDPELRSSFTAHAAEVLAERGGGWAAHAETKTTKRPARATSKKKASRPTTH